jgi:hypothetical protein
MGYRFSCDYSVDIANVGHKLYSIHSSKDDQPFSFVIAIYKMFNTYF